ncbi:ABC transporter permease [Mammaliicoccus sciuri]|uniref:ABC transporter permease n=1 Tax=Mammaliicoccus sciuri TaxID=1296 RepID=UPI001FB4E05D|nr:ABC transporter permease [Mammaliicoccus sciuri]MCJ1779794.1 ABC transporter permease [Mammaliicoccus sciuri]
MNELFEQHIKHFPHMLKYCFYEVKTHYKYYVSAFAIMLVLLIFTYLKLWITDAIDVQQSTSYYKLIGFFAYVWVFLSLFNSEKTVRKQGALYNRFSVPYYVGASSQVFLTMIMFLIVVTLTGIVSTFSTSNLIEINHLGFFYYLVMAYILLVPVASIIGVFGKYVYSARFIVFGLLIVLLFVVPILYVPNNMYAVWVNVLKLNPLFYIINGFQQSMVLGNASVTNLPYHILFYFEVAFIYLAWININKAYKTEYFK